MTDWLMVIITAVYVVATIAICYFNAKSAKAARDQLEESKQQYEKSSRLQCMPFLQLEPLLTSPDEFSFIVRINIAHEKKATRFTRPFALKNLGNGTAINIVYD